MVDPHYAARARRRVDAERAVDTVRSDQRPHGAKDRCVFGCCELVDTLAEALKNLRFRALTNALVAGDIDKADDALAAWRRTHSDDDDRRRS